MKYLLIILLNTFILNAYALTGNNPVENMLIMVSHESHNKEFIKEGYSYTTDYVLKEDYKALATEKIKGEEYAYMKKICKNYKISKEICLAKFIEDIENNKDYIKFRVEKLEINNKTEDREYINHLYSKYPESKEYIRVNFDTNHVNIIPFSKDDLKITDISYAKGIKRERINEFLNYYFIFGVFIFLLMIGKDFKSKKTKVGPLIYITLLSFIYLNLYFL